MKKKIYLGLDCWYPYLCGPNVVLANNHKYLVKTNDVKTVVPSYGKKNNEKGDQNYGIETIHVQSIPFFGYKYAFPGMKKGLSKDVKNADILHAHSPFLICRYFNKMGKKYNIPSVFTFHTKFKDDFKRVINNDFLVNICMKFMMKAINNVDYVITVSEGAKQALLEYGYKGDVSVIRNGTDMTLPEESKQAELIERVNTEYNLKDQENLLLFVGRIVTPKNLPLVMEALKIVKERGIPFKMIVVGDGEMRTKYIEQVKEMGLENEIEFIGAIYDREFLKGFYLRADLFLFPSVYDTASLCPIEAATFSLPTLLIKGSPTAEIVEDNKTGFAEEPTAEKWADRIIEIFSDKEKLKTVGDNARKYVYRTWEDVVNEVDKKYDEIIADYKEKRKN